MAYNDKGEEILDDTPIESPIRFRRPPSIQELIAMHVRAQFQMERAMGKEDENDFSEENDGDDILTPYELDAHVADADAEFRRAEQSKAVLDKYKKKKDNKDTVNDDRVKENKDVRFQTGKNEDRVREHGSVRGDSEEVLRGDEGGRLEAGSGKDGSRVERGK